MPDRKYIFHLDIDGTLYTDDIICERNRRAVQTVRDNGHLVFINTGRSIGIIPQTVAEFPVDGFVTALGSNILIGGRLVYSKLIPTDRLAAMFRHFTSLGRGILYEGNDIIIINGVFGYSEYKTAEVSTEEEFLEIAEKHDIPKIFVPGELSPEERKYCEDNFTFIQHAGYAEISPKGDNKATGMRRVAEFYAPEEYITVAMGDSLNDVEMLEAADIAVGMGDCHEKIKPLCDIITCNAADGGVAEAMYKITGIEEK